MINCSLNYNLNWINIDPTKKKMEAKFKLALVAPDGTTASFDNPDKSEIIPVVCGPDYDLYFSLPIQISGVNTTMGELIDYMVQLNAHKENNEFPVNPESHAKLFNAVMSALQSIQPEE